MWTFMYCLIHLILFTVFALIAIFPSAIPISEKSNKKKQNAKSSETKRQSRKGPALPGKPDSPVIDLFSWTGLGPVSRFFVFVLILAMAIMVGLQLPAYPYWPGTCRFTCSQTENRYPSFLVRMAEAVVHPLLKEGCTVVLLPSNTILLAGKLC